MFKDFEMVKNKTNRVCFQNETLLFALLNGDLTILVLKWRTRPAASLGNATQQASYVMEPQP